MGISFREALERAFEAEVECVFNTFCSNMESTSVNGAVTMAEAEERYERGLRVAAVGYGKGLKIAERIEKEPEQ